MIGFTKQTASDLLLNAIRSRVIEAQAEYARLPEWQRKKRRVPEELLACAEGEWVRWLPTSWFPSLTRHHRNIAGETIRDLAREGAVDVVCSSPCRIYWDRLTAFGKSRLHQ